MERKERLGGRKLGEEGRRWWNYSVMQEDRRKKYGGRIERWQSGRKTMEKGQRMLEEGGKVRGTTVGGMKKDLID